MFDCFRRYIQDKVSIDKTDFELIESVSVIKKLSKHQLLLTQGEICTFNAFVCQGFLRKYLISEKGIEQTLYFAIENWWISDRKSLMDGSPSKFNIDAVENTIVLLISKSDFKMICEKIPAFKEMVNIILQRSLNTAHKRIAETFHATAEEKYLQFLNDFPNMANRSPRNMLASYLGITAETLSRVRRHMSGK